MPRHKLPPRPMPPFIPTDRDRVKVRVLVAAGVTTETIAKVITNPRTGNGINQKTLLKAFRRELDEGRDTINAQINMALCRLAVNGNLGAIVWWQKQQMRIDDRREQRELRELTASGLVLEHQGSSRPDLIDTTDLDALSEEQLRDWIHDQTAA